MLNESVFFPNAAVNDDVMDVDAPSNDANKEGEDTNMEEENSPEHIPRVTGGEPTTACPSMSSDADGDATDEKEEEGVGGMWELTKIVTP
jgi:hypothetical protein